MAIYSVGRKRVIIALLLTTVLLLTLDLRGNPVIDKMREGFGHVLDPVESATGVVTNPLQRVWHGIANYDDLRKENRALQEQVDRLIGTQAAAEAAVLEGKELQALYSLPSLSGIDTEVARVIGYSPNNLDQVIEIDKGSSSGIDVGMAVVNQAGLVGKVTRVSRNSALVMLVTDARYKVGVTITSSSGADPATVSNTSPSGMTADEIAAAETTTTTTTRPPAIGAFVPGVTLPDGSPVPDTTLPGGSDLPADGVLRDRETGEPLTDQQLDDLRVLAGQTPEAETSADSQSAAPDGGTTTTTSTTVPPVIEKEYGKLEGRGRSRLPQVMYLADSPTESELMVGDLVFTAGGATDLAPTGIPVGYVLNRADRPGSGGPLLDVQLYADLTRLNFVRVVLYKPLSEVDQ